MSWLWHGPELSAILQKQGGRKMISRLCLTAGILILLPSACGKIPAKEEILVERERTPCTPSFRELPNKEIHVDAGTWQIYFSAILIGCEKDISSLTPEELSAIAIGLEKYRGLPSFRLSVEATWPKTRAVAKERVNALLGRSIVTDVFIYNVTIIDHNAMTIDRDM